MRALCDALVNHTELEEINLSDNAFGGRSAEPMVNFLSNNHHFSVLRLNNNGLGIQGGTIIANALIKAAEKLRAQGKESNLRTIICGRNRLENGSAPIWAEAFSKHGRLREVRMFQNGIRMEGIEALSRGLSKCPELETLDLQDNTATFKGSRAIAAALPSWPKLTTLNLSDMLLKPKGGALILAALGKGKNTNLQSLGLQYDDLDRKALALLANAVSAHLTKLTKLDINGNWADEDDECIQNIKKALEKHGNEDALDELDEMDPEGEEDEEEDESEGEERSDVVSAQQAENAKEIITPSTERVDINKAVTSVGAAGAGTEALAGGASAVATTEEAKVDSPIAVASIFTSEASAKSFASEYPASEPVAPVALLDQGSEDAIVSSADDSSDSTSEKIKSFAEVAAAGQTKAQAMEAQDAAAESREISPAKKELEEEPIATASAPEANADTISLNAAAGADGGTSGTHVRDAKADSSIDATIPKQGDTSAAEVAQKLDNISLNESAALKQATRATQDASAAAQSFAIIPEPQTQAQQATHSSHAKSSNVDLSDELYTKVPAKTQTQAFPEDDVEASSFASGKQTAEQMSSQSIVPSQAEQPKKGFKGALGAIKELLFK